MSEKKISFLKNIITEILEKHPEFFQKKEQFHDWYEAHEYFWNQNQIFLKEVVKELHEKYQENYSAEELFYMQKLYLMYPLKVPKKLLSLPWEQVKILLDLCNVKKRNFYISLCYEKRIDEHSLQLYLLNDLYEKALILKKKNQEKLSFTSKEFLDKLLNIYPIIWQ